MKPSDADPFKGVANEGDLGAELRVKGENMGAYKAATDSSTSAPSESVRSTSTSPKDKINPTARYGIRGGEKRIDVSDMVKPLGAAPVGGKSIFDMGGKVSVYDKGGKVNVKDGKHALAIVKDGERVLTEGQDKEYQKMKSMKDKMVSNLSDEDGAKPKKEIKEMHIRKSANGKHIVKHVHHHSSHPDEEHVMDGMAALHAHMDQHAGEPNEGEAAPAEGAQAPAQMTAAPSPMPAPSAGPMAGGQ